MRERSEDMLRAKEKREWYDYYRSLGYDTKVSFVLALFEYGTCRYRDLTIDRVYDALMSGESYIPEEYRERMDRRTRFPESIPRPLAKGSGAAKKMAMPAGRPLLKAAASTPRPEPEIEGDSLAGSLAETMFAEGYADAARPSAPLEIPMFLKAGSSTGRKASFSTDEYEPIEEKDPVDVVNAQTSTFRMTTNTASAGIVLNQLRNGRRIDRNMVRIEEMLNYFRYSTPVPEEETFGISLEAADAGERRKYLYIN